jgi:hypothetical protein
MKKSARILIAVLIGAQASFGSTLLQQGDTASFLFDLSDVGSGHSASANQTRVGVHFLDLAASESFSLKVYDDVTFQNLLFSALYSGGNGNVFYDFSPAIADLGGVLRISMLNGSATFDEFFVTIATPSGNFYSKKYPNPIAIPEPSTFGIVASMVWLEALTLRRKQREEKCLTNHMRRTRR